MPPFTSCTKIQTPQLIEETTAPIRTVFKRAFVEYPHKDTNNDMFFDCLEKQEWVGHFRMYYLKKKVLLRFMTELSKACAQRDIIVEIIGDDIMICEEDDEDYPNKLKTLEKVMISGEWWYSNYEWVNEISYLRPDSEDIIVWQ